MFQKVSNIQFKLLRAIRLLVIMITFLIFGCESYQYVPSPQFAPVNTEKGSLTANYSFNYAQIGYAFADNFSVFASGFRRKNTSGFLGFYMIDKENSGDTLQWDYFKNIEFGLTFFKKVNNMFHFEIVLGSGYGTVDYGNSVDWPHDYMFTFNSKQWMYFLQPNFTLNLGSLINVPDVALDITFIPNFRYSRYFDVARNLDLGDQREILGWDRYLNENNNLTNFFFEPGIQFRMGIKNIKFQVQVNHTFGLQKSGIRYLPSNIFLGISLNMNLLKKKDK